MHGTQSGSMYSRHTLTPRYAKKQYLTGNVAAAASINDYCPGAIYVVASQSEKTNMGQVYINYDITFHIPQPGNMYE